MKKKYRQRDFTFLALAQKKNKAMLLVDMKKNRGQPKKIYLRFNNPSYEKIVRANTEELARQMGFDEDQIYEISLAVDEAYTNAIEHSGDFGIALDLEIEYLVYEDRLEISITDTGCGFDSTRVQIPSTLRTLTTIRGRGLALIKSLSDSFELLTRPGAGTFIKIIKYLTSGKTKSRFFSV
jgi:serine/threonine-protein kinase RsbW